MKDTSLAIYQAENGAIELPVDATNETIWATQRQIAEVFGVTTQNVTLHLKAIYDDGEMDMNSTCKKSLQVQKEGSREVTREVLQYNLDAVIAVGYRIGSSKGTAFRKWATQTLKGYIADGFAINPARIEHNKSHFLRAIEDMKLIAAKTDVVGSSEVSDLAVCWR